MVLTAFVKILKKHDKSSDDFNHATSIVMPWVINSSFLCSPVLNALIGKVEELFVRAVYHGNHKKGMLVQFSLPVGLPCTSHVRCVSLSDGGAEGVTNSCSARCLLHCGYVILKDAMKCHHAQSNCMRSRRCDRWAGVLSVHGAGIHVAADTRYTQ